MDNMRLHFDATSLRRLIRGSEPTQHLTNGCDDPIAGVAHLDYDCDLSGRLAVFYFHYVDRSSLMRLTETNVNKFPGWTSLIRSLSNLEFNN
jgi:hypothetical protein